jgi:signal transduction histidine kinase
MLPDHRVRQREYLLEISRALTEELNLNTLLSRILHIAIEMLGGHAGFIALAGNSGDWHIAINQGIPPALSTYLENWLVSVSSSEEGAEARIPEINRMLSDISMGMISGVGIAMKVRRSTIGQIFVFRNYRASFSANDYSILNSFANQAAIAVRNARLYTQVSRQNLRMAALLNSVADGILILSPDLKILQVNHAFERLVNATTEELINKDFDEVVRWSKPPKGIQLDEAVKSQWHWGASKDLFLEGDMLRGSPLDPIPVEITYAPLFSDEGELLNIIASVRDITRFREAEELKTSFISVISHELKTPIALIKGYASTLRREDVEWDKTMVNESLRVIESEADRLTAMVEDLLDATRLQSGGITLHKTEVDLTALINDLSKKFELQSDEHQISANLSDDLPTVIADETRVSQLISNLLTNAFKYSEGGSVQINGKKVGENVQICVTDQGKGFDPVDVPYVFNRFYRSNGVAKTTKGTGLGLYLCQSIVKAHGGRIWVDESYHKGAKICFTLPVNAPSQTIS